MKVLCEEVTQAQLYLSKFVGSVSQQGGDFIGIL